MRISLSLLSLLLLVGCATIVRGTEQNVTVDTVPSGANVQFSNGQTSTSPCSIAAKRNKAINVSVSMAGCASQTAFVDRGSRRAAAFWADCRTWRRARSMTSSRRNCRSC